MYFLVGVLISILFYNTVQASVLFVPVCIILIKKKNSENILKLKEKYSLQFCDLLDAVALAVKAGKSIDKAFELTIGEMEDIHGEESFIVNEIKYMVLQNNLGISIEQSLMEFSSRCNIDEIKSFSEIFSSAKRSDGNILGIIAFTTGQIRENIEINKEMETAITAVKSELTIMEFMPVVLMILMRTTSKDFFSCMYGNVAGIVFMTIILIIYVLVVVISKRMIASLCMGGN